MYRHMVQFAALKDCLICCPMLSFCTTVCKLSCPWIVQRQMDKADCIRETKNNLSLNVSKAFNMGTHSVFLRSSTV